MKKSIHFMFVITGLAANLARAAEPQGSTWGPLTNGIQMSIALRQNEGHPGTNEPALSLPLQEASGGSSNQAAVVLHMTLRNLSSNLTFAFYRAGGLERSSGINFVVTTPSGQKAEVNLNDSGHSSGGLVFVRPGEVREFPFHLTRFLKFDENGVYAVTAKWALGEWRGTRSVQVVSNPLKIAVTRDPWSVHQVP